MFKDFKGNMAHRINRNKWFGKAKYWFIHGLDRNPEYCWANLVLWAEGEWTGYTFLSLLFNNRLYKTRTCGNGDLLLQEM